MHCCRKLTLIRQRRINSQPQPKPANAAPAALWNVGERDGRALQCLPRMIVELRIGKPGIISGLIFPVEFAQFDRVAVLQTVSREREWRLTLR